MRYLFSILRFLPIENRKGAVTVEYVFAMIIAVVIFLGVFEIFRAMSIEIILGFSGWVVPPYP